MKARILFKDTDGQKTSTTAYLVWGINGLNQRRQYATDGVRFFYQPTTRSPFKIVSEWEIPVAARDDLEREKGEFKTSANKIRHAYEAHFGEPIPEGMTWEKAGERVLVSMGYAKGKAFIESQPEVTRDEELKVYTDLLLACPEDWVAGYLGDHELQKVNTREDIARLVARYLYEGICHLEDDLDSPAANLLRTILENKKG